GFVVDDSDRELLGWVDGFDWDYCLENDFGCCFAEQADEIPMDASD
nr:hypothetical protein [Tanacetum cinerariifolium]